VRVTTGRLVAWVAIAAATGVGAFAVGHSDASGSESLSLEAAAGPHKVTVPDLSPVAPLPSMMSPPKPRHQEEQISTEEPSLGETASEYETYEAPAEEAATPSEESSGSGNEAAAPPAEEAATQEPTETGPSGGGEELVPEG
jgi:hypothetical protein